MYIFAPPRSPLRLLGHILAAAGPLALGVVFFVHVALARSMPWALRANRIALGVAVVNVGLTYSLIVLLRHSVPQSSAAGVGSPATPPPVRERRQSGLPWASYGVLVFPAVAIALLLPGTSSLARTFMAYTCLTIGIAANVLLVMLAPAEEHQPEFATQQERSAASAPVATTSTPATSALAPPQARQRHRPRHGARQSASPESVS